ncbi:hypothetical protein N7444_008485 [Penicillium canescens]|nr:hypothetical protein N7444_008485 [Penicillium canescens]
MISDKKAMVSVKDRDILALYYMKAFEDLQQTNCRILAKAYIKLVEPRKQVNYPYNGRKIVAMAPRQFDPEMTKPPWWPSGVSHREPDHLAKNAFSFWFTSFASCAPAMGFRSQNYKELISLFAI